MVIDHAESDAMRRECLRSIGLCVLRTLPFLIESDAPLSHGMDRCREGSRSGREADMVQPTDDTEELAGIDASDLLKMTFNTSPEQLAEEEYRRGYGDGFIQAVDAFWDLLERKHGRDKAYEQLWRHWETGALGDWVRNVERDSATGRQRRKRQWLSTDLPPMVDTQVPRRKVDKRQQQPQRDLRNEDWSGWEDAGMTRDE